MYNDYIRENYDQKTVKQIAKELHISGSRVWMLASAMGLSKHTDGKKTPSVRKVYKTVVVEHFVPNNKPVTYGVHWGSPLPEKVKEGGFCCDCRHYVQGGWCSRLSIETGYLNQKICFTEK